MDYVVAGFGIGAILALVGFALWELFGNVEEPGQGWIARAAIGLMLGALIIWAVTGVTLISDIDDSTGSRLVLLTSLITLIAIAADTAWYWHVDSALMEQAPAQPRVRAETQAVAPKPVQPVQSVEQDVVLSEWDSWPERPAWIEDEVKSPTVAAAVAFEPEVAAPAPEIDLEVEETAETETLLDPIQDVVDALPADVTSDEVVTEDVLVIEESAVKESSSSNVRAFRLRPRPVVELAPPVPEIAIEIAETIEVEAVETREVVEIEEIDEVEEIVEVEEVEVATVEPDEAAAPMVFESSLLADIDGSTVDADGRFSSPLLSDLVADPNELEGVGLTKWRPEARLMAAEPEESTNTKKK